MDITTIVIGLDGSDGSHRAARWLAVHAGSTDTKVIAVTALDPETQLMLDLPPSGMHNWRRRVQSDLTTTWTQVLRDAGLNLRTIVADDRAASALIGVASHEKADLIVVGANGHGGLGDRLLGSVSYRLVHLAQQPVTVVPPGWRPGTAHGDG